VLISPQRATSMSASKFSTEWLTFLATGGNLPSMSDPAAELDGVFSALADPTRRAILTDLAGGARTVGELAAPHVISLAAISKHLRILTKAGLVTQTRAGRSTTCRIEPDALRGAGVWLQGLGGFDAEDYDALEALIDRALAHAAEDLD
jgi:DNA-binding transcriptional ArsR family regulator